MRTKTRIRLSALPILLSLSSLSAAPSPLRAIAARDASTSDLNAPPIFAFPAPAIGVAVDAGALPPLPPLPPLLPPILDPSNLPSGPSPSPGGGRTVVLLGQASTPSPSDANGAIPFLPPLPPLPPIPSKPPSPPLGGRDGGAASYASAIAGTIMSWVPLPTPLGSSPPTATMAGVGSGGSGGLLFGDGGAGGNGGTGGQGGTSGGSKVDPGVPASFSWTPQSMPLPTFIIASVGMPLGTGTGGNGGGGGQGMGGMGTAWTQPPMPSWTPLSMPTGSPINFLPFPSNAPGGPMKDPLPPSYSPQWTPPSASSPGSPPPPNFSPFGAPLGIPSFAPTNGPGSTRPLGGDLRKESPIASPSASWTWTPQSVLPSPPSPTNGPDGGRRTDPMLSMPASYRPLESPRFTLSGSASAVASPLFSFSNVPLPTGRNGDPPKPSNIISQPGIPSSRPILQDLPKSSSLKELQPVSSIISSRPPSGTEPSGGRSSAVKSSLPTFPPPPPPPRFPTPINTFVVSIDKGKSQTGVDASRGNQVTSRVVSSIIKIELPPTSRTETPRIGPPPIPTFILSSVGSALAPNPPPQTIRSGTPGGDKVTLVAESTGKPSIPAPPRSGDGKSNPMSTSRLPEVKITPLPSATSRYPPPPPPPPPPPAATSSGSESKTITGGLPPPLKLPINTPILRSGTIRTVAITHTGEGSQITSGLVACKDIPSNTPYTVAVSTKVYMGTSGTSSSCGKKIRAMWGGKSVDVTVVNACRWCGEWDLDFNSAAWTKLGVPAGVGRLPGLEWSFIA